MKAVSYACFKLESNATKSVSNKNNFIKVIGDNFAVSIKCGEINILFFKDLFSCINYLRLLILVTKEVTEDIEVTEVTDCYFFSFIFLT